MERRPLVLDSNGTTLELPVGDTLPSATATPNLITTAYAVPADTSTMIVGTIEITATGSLDNSGNVGVW